MAAFLILRQEVAARRAIRRERVFKDRLNPLETLEDRDLIDRYRFSRNTIVDICNLVRGDIERPTNRCHSLSVSIQVLATLRFFATGCFQSINADVHGISKASVCRSINAVSSSICHNINNFIQLPKDRNELTEIKNDFYQIASFPNVIGAVDGTLIPIKAPIQDEHLYVSRKGYHAINVQAVCTSSLKFIDVVAKFPGSTHDSYIWNTSSLSSLMEIGEFGDGWLLGDSAYALRPWLLTPVATIVNRKDKKYNSAHCRTRNTIERAFGILKQRFRCVHKSGGCLQFDPQRSVKVILSTFALHNMAIKNNLPLPCDELLEEEEHDGEINPYIGHLNDGQKVREQLIQNCF